MKKLLLASLILFSCHKSDVKPTLPITGKWADADNPMDTLYITPDSIKYCTQQSRPPFAFYKKLRGDTVSIPSWTMTLTTISAYSGGDSLRMLVITRYKHFFKAN